MSSVTESYLILVTYGTLGHASFIRVHFISGTFGVICICMPRLIIGKLKCITVLEQGKVLSIKCDKL